MYFELNGEAQADVIFLISSCSDSVRQKKTVQLVLRLETFFSATSK